MTMNTWSKTASSNSTADSSVNWAEGQAPSSVNDSARAMMAAVAKYRDDNSGSLTTGGSSTAYTLTTSQVFASLSAMSGMSLRVKFNATNGAAPTLNVDGLGAKSLVTVAGTAVGTGSILANSVYDLVYDNSNSCWVVVGSTVQSFPQGTKMLFQQTAAPTGWTKDTTHNDKALRVVSGTASSGGSSPFTTAFSSSRTISQANLPNVNFIIAAGQGSHTHVINHNPVNGDGVGGTGQIGTGATGYNNTVVDIATATLPQMTAASGGSGTGMDFAVQYVDCIVATKD